MTIGRVISGAYNKHEELGNVFKILARNFERINQLEDLL
jgi:hypothetical protein